MPTEDVRRPFSLLVRAMRSKANLSQQQLADKVGVNQVTISAWERGENIPGDDEKIIRLGEALAIPLEVIADVLNGEPLPAEYEALTTPKTTERTARQPLVSASLDTLTDMQRKSFEMVNFVKQTKAQLHYTNVTTTVPERMVTDAFKFVFDEILELRQWQQRCREQLFDLQQTGRIPADVNLSAVLYED